MAGTKKGGAVPKDKKFTEEINKSKSNKLNRNELRAAKLQKQKEELERLKQEKELQKLASDLEKAKRKLGVDGATQDEYANEIDDSLATPPTDPQDEDDVKSAYRMLQDMRWVYRNVRGRKKLKDLVMTDDKQFVTLVKELMKIEAQLMSAEIRSKEAGNAGGQNTVFVVLKGLQDDPRLSVGSVKSGTVDFRQISHVLDPESAPYEPEVENSDDDE